MLSLVGFCKHIFIVILYSYTIEIEITFVKKKEKNAFFIHRKHCWQFKGQKLRGQEEEDNRSMGECSPSAFVHKN